ncbi:SDR family oxidoreductase [Pseudomonas sp. S31]|uniref:SDR family oxidoreductase n=1 Tax=Pseudomonas sp. S31 TaxID=1564473 RepID=UPI0019112620|nr:SDR family oxidoreductase [Pseudomonas sp. S31]MBK5002065.1 SDR family oxidoreductase [Pseudomonas sp. S31]
MANELEGKVAAVTGAASGIGLATTEAMLAAGAFVVLVDRDQDALGRACERLGEAAVPLHIDLLDPDSCSTLLRKVLELAGKLDILYANAGCYLGGEVVDADPAAIDRMLNLNVNAVIKNVRDVLPHMLERGTGDIVVTGSVAGHFPVAWEPVYSASKWAVNCFVQTTRRQVNTKGVRIGAVSPGPVVSPLLADWPAENLAKAKANGTLIEPEVVADAVMYMLTRPRNVTIRDMVVLPSAFDM